MFTHEQRIEVFQDTMDWIKNDSNLSASITTAKKKSNKEVEEDE